MSERAEHTPGDWETDLVARFPDKSIGVFAGEGVACIARVLPGCLPANGRIDAVKANARLISASPNLLEACRQLVANLNGSKEFAKEVIAKATGEKS